MTAARKAAWDRYAAARINVLSAGALVAALVDAYEEIERMRSLLAISVVRR